MRYVRVIPFLYKTVYFIKVDTTFKKEIYCTKNKSKKKESVFLFISASVTEYFSEDAIMTISVGSASYVNAIKGTEFEGMSIQMMAAMVMLEVGATKKKEAEIRLLR